MATHSSILAWRVPWTEEPGSLQSMGLPRVRHDWATNTFLPRFFWHLALLYFACTAFFTDWRFVAALSQASLLVPGMAACSLFPAESAHFSLLVTVQEFSLYLSFSPYYISWNSSTLATSCEELTHWKRPWCWEGLGAGGEGDDRGWDGWMASLTRWMWVSVNSGSWWWTGRPGVLRFMGSQRVGHDWATDLIWSDLMVISDQWSLILPL